jgi:hypothetical protein
MIVIVICAVNALLLVLYLLLSKNPIAWDLSSFHAMAIGIYLLHAITQTAVFSLLETIKYLSRISLIHKNGLDYEERDVQKYQEYISPPWAGLLALVYAISTIASFVLLMINYGWAVAIIGHVASYCSLGIVILPYTLFFSSIRRAIMRLHDVEKTLLSDNGVDVLGVLATIDYALSDNINMPRQQNLWVCSGSGRSPIV